MAILQEGEVPQFELLSCVFSLSGALHTEKLWTRYFATMGYSLTFGITNPAYSAREYAHAFEPDYAAEALTVDEAFAFGLSVHLQCLDCGHIRVKGHAARLNKSASTKKSLAHLRAEQRYCFECSGQAFCVGAVC